jgi:hypothetical protein
VRFLCHLKQTVPTHNVYGLNWLEGECALGEVTKMKASQKLVHSSLIRQIPFSTTVYLFLNLQGLKYNCKGQGKKEA